MIPAIIPYYKNKSQLAKCISHLEAQTVDVDIFVRDNDKDNVYYTAAVNEGIRKYLRRSCKYILVLNQDMYLEPRALEEMAAFMDAHPQCGIGAPLQLYAPNPRYVIFAGGCEAFPMGKHQHGPLREFMQDKEIRWASGACMILRKEMILEIGLLDENYVFIGSDSDYSFTARSRGWQVWAIAGARGVHEHGASGKLCDSNVELLKIKDMIYFGRKWLTGEVYRNLSHQGANLTPETTADIMDELRQTKIELERFAGDVVTTGRAGIGHSLCPEVLCPTRTGLR
jgi:GT2 family glycosyltransferase